MMLTLFYVLAAVLVLGPRSGRFSKNGSIKIMPGHNLPLAALGAFILWFGWFGFNPGSTLSGMDGNIARIAVNTNLSAAAGGTVAALLTLVRYGKADLTMAINGALGGLVAITAGCAFVTPVSSLLIGAAAGALIIWAVPFFDRIHADDPVGAIAVHGVCGTFGTLAVGLFAQNGGLFYGGGLHLLGVETLGVAVIGLWRYYGLSAPRTIACAWSLSTATSVTSSQSPRVWISPTAMRSCSSTPTCRTLRKWSRK